MNKIIKANKYIYDIKDNENIEFVNRYNQKIEKELDPNNNYLFKFWWNWYKKYNRTSL